MVEESGVKKVFGHLTSEVHSDLCANCGACLASCPVDSLDLEGGRPSLTGRCTACGLCYAQCPQVVTDEEVMERVFGEVSSSKIGPYKDAYFGRTNSSPIEVVAQDGGIVTSLLDSLLEAGFIDGAAVMDRDSEWRPEPRVAISREDLIECAGTKYTPGPILRATREAVELYSLENLALVGTPCQVKALRNMASGDYAVRRITDNVKLIIGLFCTKCFDYEDFFEEVLEDQLDIDLSDVAKFDVKDERFIIYQKNKSKRELALDSLDQFTFHPCKLCSDFSAELADISVGGVGSPEGYSTVIVRTEVGEKAFKQGLRSGAYEAKDLEDADPGLDLVEKLSTQKKENAEKMASIYRRKGKPLPPRLRSTD